MAKQDQRSGQEQAGTLPAFQPDQTEAPAPVRIEKLGLDDVTDAERLAATSPAIEEGGLGFDDVADQDLALLDETLSTDGGLGLDDVLIPPDDEDEYRAA